MYIFNKDLTFCQNLSLYYFRLINILIFYDFFKQDSLCITFWYKVSECCSSMLFDLLK